MTYISSQNQRPVPLSDVHQSARMHFKSMFRTGYSHTMSEDRNQNRFLPHRNYRSGRLRCAASEKYEQKHADSAIMNLSHHSHDESMINLVFAQSVFYMIYSLRTPTRYRRGLNRRRWVRDSGYSNSELTEADLLNIMETLALDNKVFDLFFQQLSIQRLVLAHQQVIDISIGADTPSLFIIE